MLPADGLLGLKLGLDYVEGAGGDAGDETTPRASLRKVDRSHDMVEAE